MNEHLAITRRDLASAERTVAAQEQRLSKLQAKRGDTTQAYRLLATYRELLRKMREDCARLEANAAAKSDDAAVTASAPRP